MSFEPTPRSDAPTQPAPAETDLHALRRRRVLLSGLGKGAAGAAALAPLASHATRNYTLFNPSLGRNGYCSVSGFQSAAISLAPGQSFTTCSSLKPGDYFETKVEPYSNATTAPDNTKQRRGIQAMMSTKFGVTVSNTDADRLKTVNNKVTISGKVYIAESSSSIRELKAKAAFPTTVASVTPTTPFNTLMGGSGSVTDTVLYVLYMNTNNAYFAAVFLSCIREDGAIVSSSGFTSGVIPFDAKYVKDQYASNQVAAGSFFKLLCGA